LIMPPFDHPVDKNEAVLRKMDVFDIGALLHY
jgi:hypothetical protein